MKTRGRELSPDEVIAWLRSPAGEQWSSRRNSGPLYRHLIDSGVFADVIRDGSAGSYATWPEPRTYDSLDG